VSLKGFAVDTACELDYTRDHAFELHYHSCLLYAW
jgi:hypothetical protein